MDTDGSGARVTVCLLSPSALPLVVGDTRRAGGAELDVWQIATALARDARYRVVLAAIGDRNERRAVDGVEVVSIARYRPEHTRRGYFARYCARVVRTLRAVNADVYFSKGASLEAILCYAAARVGRRRGFVFRFQHDWETHPDSLGGRIFSGQRRLAGVFEYVLRHSDALVTQTVAQQQLLRRNFALESTALYNSHPIPAPAALDRRCTVLWVGRAAPYKRPEVFLSLARRLPGHPFVMIATLDGNYPAVLPALRADIRELPNVTLIEGAPREEVEAHFRSARVFVLSSEAEGFPNVLVEAWKNGTPVASLSLDPDGLIRRSDAGIVAGGDLETLVRGVDGLLRDDELFSRTAANAYGVAQTRLNIERTIVSYKELLDAVVGQRQGPSRRPA